MKEVAAPMQYQNNKKLAYIGLGIIVMLVGLFLLFSNNETPQDSEDFLQTYYDPVSGETLTNPIGKTQESYGNNPDTTTFLGFRVLTSLGVSNFQLEGLLESLRFFADEQKLDPNEISLFPDPITFIEPADDSFNLDTVSFDIQIERKEKVHINMTRHSLSSISIKITDSNGQVYKLEKIDVLSDETSV